MNVMQRRMLISAVVAVGLHAGLLISCVMALSLDIVTFPEAREPEYPEPDPEQVVVLQTFVKEEQLPPAPIPEKKPEAQKSQQTKKVPADDSKKLKTLPKQKRRFASTSPDQAGTPDTPTDLLGERDTRAASELAPTAGAPDDLPSQSGKAPLHPDHIETVTKTYQDGSVGMDSHGQETDRPQEATAGGKESLAPEELKVPKPVKPQESLEKKDEYLKQGELLARKQEEKKQENEAQKLASKKSDEESRGKEKNQDTKKNTFSEYKSKTKVTGSISRSGKSALNVKNSPLGRYQALVSKAVELQWRRNCAQHSDHIVPGVISLRFYVDKKGEVSGIKFQDVVGANYIERGFTQRAIRQAEIPKMPKAVLKELKGDPLELIYNFYF